MKTDLNCSKKIDKHLLCRKNSMTLRVSGRSFWQRDSIPLEAKEDKQINNQLEKENHLSLEALQQLSDFGEVKRENSTLHETR